jgi:septal ring factor EnvC (AmiA/AmiB activator)
MAAQAKNASMSDQGEGAQEATDPFRQGAEVFTKFWTDFANKMAAAGFAAAPGATPPEATRQVRSAILKAMSEASDEFMRSPQFQEMMKQSLANSIQFRKQLNEWLGQMQHEFQGTSRQDVDELMQVMKHLEHRMSDGFERLSVRLDALEKARPKPAPPVTSPRKKSRRAPARVRSRSKP